MFVKYKKNSIVYLPVLSLCIGLITENEKNWMLDSGIEYSWYDQIIANKYNNC